MKYLILISLFLIGCGDETTTVENSVEFTDPEPTPEVSVSPTPLPIVSPTPSPTASPKPCPHPNNKKWCKAHGYN